MALPRSEIIAEYIGTTDQADRLTAAYDYMQTFDCLEAGPVCRLTRPQPYDKRCGGRLVNQVTVLKEEYPVRLMAVLETIQTLRSAKLKKSDVLAWFLAPQNILDGQSPKKYIDVDPEDLYRLDLLQALAIVQVETLQSAS